MDAHETDPPGNDDELLARARAGDHSALGSLIDRNSLRLRAKLDRRLGKALRGKIRSSDILQSTYLKVVSSIREFEGATEKDFANWIVHILENTIRARARYFATQKRDSGRERVAHPGVVDPLSSGATPSRAVSISEELRLIASAMSRLPHDYVRILTLHMDADRTHKETAEIMDRTEGASRVLLARARAALMVEMANKSPEKDD